MIFEVFDGCKRVLKSATMAQLTIAFNLLENRQKNAENAAAPESFETNDVQWIECVAVEELLFSDKLASCEALGSQQKQNSKSRSLTS